MKCGIKVCVQSDNRFLWRCHGFSCKRTYHAACIGVQRNHEDVLRAFMLPLCEECQETFTAEVKLKELSMSFQNITEDIGNTLEANHKLQASFKSLSATHDETLDRIDKMLSEIQQNIFNVSTGCKTSAAEIKLKLSTLLETLPIETSTAIEKAASSVGAAAAVAATKTATHSNDTLPLLMAEFTKEFIDMKNAFSSHSDTPSACTCEAAAASEAVAAITATATNQIPQLITALKADLAASNATLICNVKSHMNEMAKTLSAPAIHTLIQNQNDEPTPSWRILGNKKVWKRDWTEYDAKQHSRRLQEKKEGKARRRRKQRKGNHHEIFNYNYNSKDNNLKSCNNSNNSNFNSNNNGNNINNNNHKTYNNNNNRSDKQLLATAKVQFASPPSTTDHPIAALSVPKYINFRKGETINQYRNENQTQQIIHTESQPGNIAVSTFPESNATPGWSLDPMRPPIVSLTQQSADGDGRFLKARLRDPKIMYIVRLYLAYLHDKEPSFCHEGMTNTSIQMNLASEGLPTSAGELRKIFFEVHEEYGVPKQAASEDLEAYRRHLNNQRIQHLQRIRESADKFHNPNFRK